MTDCLHSSEYMVENVCLICFAARIDNDPDLIEAERSQDIFNLLTEILRSPPKV